MVEDVAIREVLVEVRTIGQADLVRRGVGVRVHWERPCDIGVAEVATVHTSGRWLLFVRSGFIGTEWVASRCSVENTHGRQPWAGASGRSALRTRPPSGAGERMHQVKLRRTAAHAGRFDLGAGTQKNP